MPISATGNNGRATEAGFSLVELVVVVFLIALMSGVVVLSLPQQAAGPKAAGEQLAARLRMAMDEAVITGRPIGVSLTSSRYRFFRREQGLWEPIAQDRVFAPTEWDEGLFVSAESGGQSLISDKSLLSGEESSSKPRAGEAPVIMFDPIGGMTPFVITLEKGGARMRITGAASGRISIDNPGGNGDA